MATKKKTAPKAKKAAPKKAPAPKKEPPKKAPAKKAAAKAKPAKPSSGGLSEGDAAPAIKLLADDGTTTDLRSFKGKAVVVYFYPRDDTPGCTIEACEFRDNMNRVVSAGGVVLGISRDGQKSHQKFKAKYSLNFPLLSDEDLAVHNAYGAWGTKNMYGKQVEGTIRSTFLIGPDGKVAKAWRKVRVAGHVDKVLDALAQLSS